MAAVLEMQQRNSIYVSIQMYQDRKTATERSLMCQPPNIMHELGRSFTNSTEEDDVIKRAAVEDQRWLHQMRRQLISHVT